MILDLQMKTQTKKTQVEEPDQAQVTVYHIAIPHQEEIWREWVPGIEKSCQRWT